MNFLEIWSIFEDETLRSSKSRYVWLFGGIFIFLCLIAMHYSTQIYNDFSILSSQFEGVPYTWVSYLLVLSLGPFIALITSFDVVSNEIETGSVRYIISKVHRSSFILGKFLSLFLVFTSVVSGIALICLIYLYSAGNGIQLEKILLFWIISIFYIGCFISIFLFISTLSVNNKISFAMSVVLLGILIYFYLQGNESFLKYLTPYYYGIKNLELMKSATCEVGYLGFFESIFSLFLYISAFLSMSLLAMKRRDL